MKILTCDSPEIEEIYTTLKEALKLIKAQNKSVGLTLNGTHYLTNKELSEVLHISFSTLQEFRSQGKLSYYMLGGKILYKVSDVHELLDINYMKGWNIK